MVADIERLEALSEDNKLGMLFYRPQEEAADSKAVRLKLFYHSDEPIHCLMLCQCLKTLAYVLLVNHL